jgi:hypothetical protein
MIGANLFAIPAIVLSSYSWAFRKNAAAKRVTIIGVIVIIVVAFVAFFREFSVS